MDPLRFTIAVIPVAVYLLILGLINLRARPFVTTGARDIGALGIGVLGLMIAGPLELFLPETVAIRFGPYVWLFLLVFYGLGISLIVLLLRPRIVVYNATVEQIRPLITDISKTLDQKSRWTGDSMFIPNRRVHFHVEAVDWLRNVQIVATGNRQSFEGWREVERRLREATEDSRVPPNFLGTGFLLVSLILAITSGVLLFQNQVEVAAAFKDFLRF
jgi:hypothetical protein